VGDTEDSQAFEVANQARNLAEWVHVQDQFSQVGLEVCGVVDLVWDVGDLVENSSEDPKFL
jgi:hypothetical protein